MSEIGSISVLLSFFISIYSLVFSIIGVKKRNRNFVKSAENGLIAIFILLLFAGGSLIYELVKLNFSLKYVALNTSTDLPFIYKISSLWAGQAGSLLLWCIILSGYTAVVVIQNKNKDRDFQPYVNATLAFISIFFLFLITYIENPFEKLDFVPNEGRGLNPILQNGYMAIHPLTLYIGYVGISIPFAFGMAALLSGKLNDSWIKNSRKWALFAWTFLSIGLLLGARWAYLELGWGGYWAWDPV
ncbi:MAG: cytochrome c biogenesis protein CcsA, partial [Thermodesulfobacteriota bacterium]